MPKRSNTPNIPKKPKPDEQHTKIWKNAGKRQSEAKPLETDKEADNLASDDSTHMAPLQQLLNSPLLNQEALDEILACLREERTKTEQIAKEVAEERVRLSILKAEAESGFAQASKQAFEEKEAAVNRLEKDSELKLEARKQAVSTELAEQKKIFEKRVSSLNQREKLLLDQEMELQEKLANANAGFIQEQKSAVEQFREQITEAQQQLALVKNQHAEEISRHKQNLGSIDSEHLDRQREQLKQKQTQLEAQQRKLIDAEAALEAQKITLKRGEALLQARQRSQDEWETSTKNKIRDDFAYKISELEGQLKREQNNLSSEQKKSEDLIKELHEFADLQRTFGNADAEEIHGQFRQLQKENRDLKARQFLDDEDLGEKCEILEEQLADRSDEIKDLRVELEEARDERHKLSMSVMEKQRLVEEKRTLEEHKRALAVSIEQLRTEIDGLIERQQGTEVFPALSSMDKKHHQPAANLQPVQKLNDFADQLRFGMASIYENSPLYYREEDVRAFLGGLAMSNLHILQGMSGTGKTSLAKAFAKVVGGDCTDIAVQAGWRDKDDLLGHFNAFEKRFYERETLQAIYRAQLPSHQDRINIILLDEMNLSRPEQYFSEFLSVIEKIRPEEREIVLIESEQKNAPGLLSEGRKLRVPENVWFIGTANHDETTNEFADKTYDRAHVMELIRNEGSFNSDAYDEGITYSFSSLITAFEKVCQQERNNVAKVLDKLSDSALSQVLESDFAVSWGNRFARHALRFLPVVKHAGGSFEEALDHLMATKVFRRGKATGRYDLVTADLDNVAIALTDTWKILGLKNAPEASLKAISKDRQRMERGV